MSPPPCLKLGSDGIYYLQHGERPEIPIRDPFSPNSSFLQEPRFDPRWQPLVGVHHYSDRNAYGVFLYSSQDRDLREWEVSPEGEYIAQRGATRGELGILLSPEQIPQSFEFASALLVAGAFRTARKIALQTMRAKVLRLEALRFLTVAYAAQGLWIQARASLHRLQKSARRKRSITGLSDDLAHVFFLEQFRAVRQPARILYLFQTPGQIREELSKAVLASGAEYLVLNFKQQIFYPRHLYKPDTTWTEGRNLLASICCSSHMQYDYFVFCDGDVFFLNSGLTDGFRYFNDQLLRHRPEIATPATPWHGDWGAQYRKDRETSDIQGFDAIFNAFSREVLAEGVVFPMIESLDNSAWWDSQFFMIYICRLCYKVSQFNRLHVSGAEHCDYPRGPRSEQVERIFGLLISQGIPAQSAPPELHRFNRSFFNKSLRDRLYRQPVFPISL